MTESAPETPQFDITKVTPDQVNRFHDHADTDSSFASGHHTLGNQSTQAAPGNHNHVMTGLTAPTTPSVLNSIPVGSLYVVPTGAAGSRIYIYTGIGWLATSA